MNIFDLRPFAYLVCFFWLTGCGENNLPPEEMTRVVLSAGSVSGVYNGQIMVYAKNTSTDQSQSLLVNSSGAGVNLTNGDYYFLALGWDDSGSSPFLGAPFCVLSGTQTLAGEDLSVSLALTSTQCLGAPFSTTSYNTASSTWTQVKIRICDPNDSAPSYSCALSSTSSRAYSVKVRFPEIAYGTIGPAVVASGTGGINHCLSLDCSTTSTTCESSLIYLPPGHDGDSYPPYFQIELFAGSSDCSGSGNSLAFLQGLSGSLSSSSAVKGFDSTNQKLSLSPVCDSLPTNFNNASLAHTLCWYSELTTGTLSVSGVATSKIILANSTSGYVSVVYKTLTDTFYYKTWSLSSGSTLASGSTSLSTGDCLDLTTGATTSSCGTPSTTEFKFAVSSYLSMGSGWIGYVEP